MSDNLQIPEVQLSGSVIHVTQMSEKQRSVVMIPVEAVDAFCEAVYWARKQHLTHQNELSRAAETEFAGFGEKPGDLQSR